MTFPTKSKTSDGGGVPRARCHTCSYAFVITRGRRQSNFSPGLHIDELRRLETREIQQSTTHQRHLSAGLDLFVNLHPS
jgi:hypothetical protein